MGWVAKTNRHVVVLVQKTVNGNANYVKRRPAIITGTAADSKKRLRVRHHGEVYGNATNGVTQKLTTAGSGVGQFVSW